MSEKEDELQVLELTQEEKKVLSSLVETTDNKDFLEKAKRIAMIVRAIDGQNVDNTGIAETLIDITDVKERSRYPTYAILSLIVYLENIASFNKNAQACKNWANTLSKALIGYKGLGRVEFTEQKRVQSIPTQQFNLGDNKYNQEAQPMKKAHFWSPAPRQKAEESEFNE
jgi:hypothetical protein